MLKRPCNVLLSLHSVDLILDSAAAWIFNCKPFCALYKQSYSTKCTLSVFFTMSAVKDTQGMMTKGDAQPSSCIFHCCPYDLEPSLFFFSLTNTSCLYLYDTNTWKHLMVPSLVGAMPTWCGTWPVRSYACAPFTKLANACYAHLILPVT